MCFLINVCIIDHINVFGIEWFDFEKVVLIDILKCVDLIDHFFFKCVLL